MAKSDPSFLDSVVLWMRCGILNTAHRLSIKVLSGVHCHFNQQKIWFPKPKPIEEKSFTRNLLQMEEL